MAETGLHPLAAELPETYATWQRQVEDAKAVLDGLLLHGISSSNVDMAYDCLSFVACTLSTVRITYQVRHARDEGVVEYDIRHAHGIGTLAVRLLEQDARGARGNLRQRLEDPLSLYRLCRACSGVCGEVLTWLPREAVDSLPQARDRAPSRASLFRPVVADGVLRGLDHGAGSAR